MITSQTTLQESDNEGQLGNIAPHLRFSLIQFLKMFCEEGIDEILKMEGLILFKQIIPNFSCRIIGR